MKSILFVSINDHAPWGGSEVLWSKTVVRLKKVGGDAKVLVKKWNTEPNHIKELKTQEITVFYKAPIKKQSFKNRLLRKFFNVPFKKIHDLEQDGLNKPALVVLSLGNHLDGQLFYYTDYLLRQQISYVIVFQLVTDLRVTKDDVLNRFRDSYSNAEKLYFLSQDNIDKAEMQFSIEFKNKELINNPFNYKTDYLPLEQEDSTKYNLGCVAALNSFHKGLDVFLKTLSAKKWIERPLQINLYGDGSNKEQIIRLIALYGLQSKVILHGHETNKKKIWTDNHACIMPSRMEGQSLAMLEAMSYGRILISTKVGDAERLVKHNETGFLIDAPTVELIDLALEKAWEKRTNWVEMGKLSRKHLFETITKDPVVDFSEKLQMLLI